jgi:hypothetical protein
VKTEVIASARSHAPFNPWLRAALAFLIVVDLLVIAVGLASIPVYVDRAANGTIESYQLGITAVGNAITAKLGAARGMTPSQYALYESLVGAAFALTVSGIGLFTLWRARNQWFGWLTAHIMLFLAAWSLTTPIQAAHLVPRAWIAGASVSWPLLVLYLFLFPDGRAIPRWARWVMAIYLPLHLLAQLSAVVAAARPELAQAMNLPAILAPLGILVGLILPFVLGCQIYRYARVSGPVQRLQTKWFLYGFALFIALSQISDWIWGAGKAPIETAYLPMAILPITLSIAILRYRLWDIDVIIRRTLIYAVVTALLAFVFFGGVILLQRLFTRLTGQESPVAVVASTLLIAALFSPLRRSVQNFVDRRFYRRKYDAQRVLESMAAVARSETDLDALTAELVAAARDTLQPASVTIWLRETGRRGQTGTLS